MSGIFCFFLLALGGVLVSGEEIEKRNIDLDGKTIFLILDSFDRPENWLIDFWQVIIAWHIDKYILCHTTGQY